MNRDKLRIILKNQIWLDPVITNLIDANLRDANLRDAKWNGLSSEQLSKMDEDMTKDYDEIKQILRVFCEHNDKTLDNEIE